MTESVACLLSQMKPSQYLVGHFTQHNHVESCAPVIDTTQLDVSDLCELD